MMPPDTEKMTSWFKSHSYESREGIAYRLAIDLDGRMIGVCDVFGIADGEGEIGYWIEQGGLGLRLRVRGR